MNSGVVAMLKPSSEGELAEAIRGANGPLSVVGGGTRGLARPGEALSVSGIAGVTLYEPGALTMVAQAGTPLADIEAALEAEGQMLAFEPYLLNAVTGAKGASTIGGVFATNASGPRRMQAGAARDFLLGVRFVDGAGNVVKNGGRVMKNVTGYDLVKLMAGSCGTLGILTEVSFKVLPKPQAQATVQIEGLTDADAVRALAAVLSSPYDVTGAAHLPDCIEKPGRTLIRVEGFADSVAYRADRLCQLLAGFGEVSVAQGHEHWAAIRAMSAYSQAARGEAGALWRVSVKPSDAPGFMAQAKAAHDVLYSYDWGGGRIWVWSRTAEVPAVHATLQQQAGRIGGHATLVHSTDSGDLPRFQPEAPAVARLSAGLRTKFDPRGILNPGLIG